VAKEDASLGFGPANPDEVWLHYPKIEGVTSQDELRRIGHMREDIVSGAVPYDDVLTLRDVEAVETSATALQGMLPADWEDYAYVQTEDPMPGPWEEA
jgi:hypothetical protein